MSSIFAFPTNLKYQLFKEPVDFRNGRKGLTKVVFRYIGKDIKDEPILFLFYNKARTDIKALLYDDPITLVFQCTLNANSVFNIPRFPLAAKTLNSIVTD